MDIRKCAYVNACLFTADNQSPRKFQMGCGGTPAWRFQHGAM